MSLHLRLPFALIGCRCVTERTDTDELARHIGGRHADQASSQSRPSLLRLLQVRSSWITFSLIDLELLNAALLIVPCE